ncbi:hypothetical protein [Pseudokineococcus lusitanus]|nr:hypothetical protein [Pseudokineococcus lusitanus]
MAGRVARRLYWPLHRAAVAITGLELPKEVVVGPGLRVHHAGTVVVHPRARLGARCTLRQGVTLGERRPGAGAPTLGDDVEVGAYAQVLGPVVVGDGARIGALALVIHDVPAGAVVAAAPARLL